jgi:hypothetical protein
MATISRPVPEVEVAQANYNAALQTWLTAVHIKPGSVKLQWAKARLDQARAIRTESIAAARRAEDA